MPVHIHTIRVCCAGALGLALLAVLFGWAYSPAEELELVPVTGRVTCGDRVPGGMWVLFEEAAPRGFTACGAIQADGSFRMQPWGQFEHDGVTPGTYRVHFIGHPSGVSATSVGPKYQDARTSDLMVHVGPAWNDFVFSLPDPGRGPTLVQHR